MIPDHNMQEMKSQSDERWMLAVVAEANLIVTENFFLDGHFFFFLSIWACANRLRNIL